MRYTVGLKELRRALQSVVVHAVNDPQVEWWHRVRLEVHPQGHVLVYASQGYTAGMAYVGVIDPGDGDLEGFDIAPARVKDLLQLFPLDNKHADEQMVELSLEGDEHFRARDVSGLFPGNTVELPRLPEQDRPQLTHIPPLLGRTVATTGKHHLQGVMVTNGEWLALFARAAKVYGEPLCVTPYTDDSGRGRLLMTVGDLFIGALIGRTSAGGGHVDESIAHRDAWAGLLPTVASHDPVVDLEAALAELEQQQDDDSDDDGDVVESGEGDPADDPAGEDLADDQDDTEAPPSDELAARRTKGKKSRS